MSLITIENKDDENDDDDDDEEEEEEEGRRRRRFLDHIYFSTSTCADKLTSVYE